MQSGEIRALPRELAVPLESAYRLWRDGILGAAHSQLTEALERAKESDHVAGQLAALHLLGNLAYDEGDLATARRLHADVLDRCLAVGFSVGVASSFHNLGLTAARQGDLAAAHMWIGEAIRTYERLGLAERVSAARENLSRLGGDRTRSIGGD